LRRDYKSNRILRGNEERLNGELQTALQEIKDLKRCIPCSESGGGMGIENGGENDG
jgi:hypothetical protein